MTTILFDFDNAASSQQFSMARAARNFSINPSAVSGPCIYVIYNQNPASHTIYVGYARNAHHRWSTRTEAFHVFGIDPQYAKNVKCAWCYPKFSNHGNPDVNNANHWARIANQDLKGQDAAEHLLIRLMIGGLFGQLTITNTSLRNTQFDRRRKFPQLTRADVYFGNKFNFAIGNRRYLNINANRF